MLWYSPAARSRAGGGFVRTRADAEAMSLAESHVAPIRATAPERAVGAEADIRARQDAPSESANARSGAGLSSGTARLVLAGIALAAMVLQGGLFFEKTW